MPIELVVPKVGESIVEVEIGEWLKQEGDTVEEDETVAMLDSEKTTVELRSPAAGVLGRIVRRQGDTAAIGEVVAYIEQSGAGAHNGVAQDAAAAAPVAAPPSSGTADRQPSEPKPEWGKSSEATVANATAASKDRSHNSPEPIAQVEKESLQAEAQTPDEAAPPLVMPAARRVLAEHGLRAEAVASSGPGGRLLKEDVQRHIGSGQPASPAEARAAPPTSTSQPTSAQPAVTPLAAAEDEEIVPMTLLRRRVAERLVEAQQNAALLTTFNEVDMSAVMALRAEHQEAFQKRYNIKLGFMSFFVKATIDALKQIPGINAEIRGKDIVYRNHYDIGVAIGSGKGLVVPVLRHAERLSFSEIEQAITDYGKRARESKLVPDDLLGGTFTISNGGVYGSLLSTPIVNPPQSGILGMHAIQERPVARNGQVVIRPMMYIALTYDHRLVDGREAVTFLIRIKECIENPARMLIEV